jgi:hypothetical protein
MNYSTQKIREIAVYYHHIGINCSLNNLWRELSNIPQIPVDRSHTPSLIYASLDSIHSALAQLVEQLTVKQWLADSNPASGAIFRAGFMEETFLQTKHL